MTITNVFFLIHANQRGWNTLAIFPSSSSQGVLSLFWRRTFSLLPFSMAVVEHNSRQVWSLFSPSCVSLLIIYKRAPFVIIPWGSWHASGGLSLPFPHAMIYSSVPFQTFPLMTAFREPPRVWVGKGRLLKVRGGKRSMSGCKRCWPDHVLDRHDPQLRHRRGPAVYEWQEEVRNEWWEWRKLEQK